MRILSNGSHSNIQNLASSHFLSVRFDEFKEPIFLHLGFCLAFVQSFDGKILAFFANI